MKNSPVSLFNWLRLKRVHILVWVIFIFYEAIIVGLIRDSFATFSNYLIHYAINISIFYVHACMVLPLAFKHVKSAIWKVPLYVLIELSICIVIVYYIDIFLIKHTDIMQTKVIGSHVRIVLGIAWRSLYFMMFGTGYYFLNAYLSERKVKDEMEKDRLLNIIERQTIEKDLEMAKSAYLIAKNAYLKAQINPHFLFNTLDFIYHDVVQHSPKSAQAVLDLADIMRFALDANHLGEYITLGEEITQLEKLISLHQVRDNGRLQLNLSYKEEVKSLKIIPLVLVTLVENMFKHGNLREKAGQMEIFTKDGYLYITTVNLIHKGKRRPGFGSGLANIKERLEDAYKGKSNFKYMDEVNCFKVQISVTKND